MHRYIAVFLILILAGCAVQQSKEPVQFPDPAPRPQRPPPAESHVDHLEVTGSRIRRSDEMRLAEIRVLRSRQPDAMFFEHYGVNPTIDTEEDQFSTFSVDVDRASFALTRAYLERGQLPPEQAIRVEEFINAMDYHYVPPNSEEFSLSAEAFPSPNRPGYHVLHLGMRARDVAVRNRRPMNLVFVVDTSGSMARDDRLGEVKRFLRRIVRQMKRGDSVAIVEYGSNARVVAQPSYSNDARRLLHAISNLSATGSTNAAEGVAIGYDLIGRRFHPQHTNRIILCSDGVANVGPATDSEGILARISESARSGVYLSTIGFGLGNYNDVLMEQLAQYGGGNYYYVDSPAESERLLGPDFLGTMETVAEDAKIQIEFDPDTVSRFRLLGYENRVMDHDEFSDDQADAGEVGSGHSITALYEVKLRDDTQDLGWMRVRYRTPDQPDVSVIERHLTHEIIRGSLDAASPPSQLALVTSMLAEKLRGSYWVRSVDYPDMVRLFDVLPPSLRADPAATELREMITKVRQMDSREDRFGAMTTDFDRVPVLR